MRVTGGQTDPELSDILVSNSRDTVMWMHGTGKIPMEPAVGLSGVDKECGQCGLRPLIRTLLPTR